MKRGYAIAGIVLMLMLNTLCGVVSAWALYDRFSETNQRRAENAAVWHAVICQIESATAGNKKVPLAQRALAVSFYDGLLIHQVHTRGCGIRVSG